MVEVYLKFFFSMLSVSGFLQIFEKIRYVFTDSVPSIMINGWNFQCLEFLLLCGRSENEKDKQEKEKRR